MSKHPSGYDYTTMGWCSNCGFYSHSGQDHRDLCTAPSAICERIYNKTFDGMCLVSNPNVPGGFEWVPAPSFGAALAKATDKYFKDLGAMRLAALRASMGCSFTTTPPVTIPADRFDELLHWERWARGTATANLRKLGALNIIEAAYARGALDTRPGAQS